MEAAVRWSPHSTNAAQRFLVVDVAGNRLRLGEIERFDGSRVKYKQLAQRSDLPNFTAFDWSKTQESFVGIGSASGEAILLEIDGDKPQADRTQSFPIKHQRKCNSIAFSSRNWLATGLDRVRNDFCMNIYDLGQGISSAPQEPFRKLATSEAITSIKFLSREPETLITGVSRQCVRIYDLRDSSGAAVSQFPTRQVHNVAIDPLDEDIFLTAGSVGEPIVSAWDRRFLPCGGRGGLMAAVSADSAPMGPVLELRRAIDNSVSSAIWSLRFAGTKRGCFGVLSSTGEIKIIELALPRVADSAMAQEQRPWNHHVRMTHNLHFPYYDKYHGREETSRIIGYDFMVPGCTLKGTHALGIRPNREIELLRIPDAPPSISMTALDELIIGTGDGFRTIGPSNAYNPIAEELSDLQKLALEKKHRNSVSSGKDGSDHNVTVLANRFHRLSIESSSHRTVSIKESQHQHRNSQTSREAHEELLSMGYPDVKLDIGDYLKVLSVQRRRCHEGYALDPHGNKDVVKNDPWLVEMWDLVQRLEDIAKDDGMISEDLDLSYLGVSSIWANSFGTKLVTPARLMSMEPFSETRFVNAVKGICLNKGYPAFQGISTKFPEHRQLCLAICGWASKPHKLRDQSERLMESGQYYKAIVLAVFKGHREVALDLLKFAIQRKLIENVGLGAVIACESVNEEQRNMCAWMAEESSDPYLKALLAYFVSGNWKVVTDMDQLSLHDRVGVALKYLDDESLGPFLSLAMSEAVVFGNIEGVVLTGLAEPAAMTLFEKYIAKFNDLQTAVLAMGVTVPRYIDEPRWEAWRDTYFHQMQAWQAFVERTRLVCQHNQRAASRDGVPLVRPYPRQVALRCAHCQLSLALRDDGSYGALPLGKLGGIGADDDGSGSVGNIATNGGQQPAQQTSGRRPRGSGPAAAAGVVCPRCGRPLPRCGICMLWLGSPDPARPGGAAALQRAQEDPMARFITFCMSCRHGFHAHHAREWFARHAMCAVPDCQCMCGVRT
ncbi:hypothetical protein BDY21DRAFT_380496 [Lineolata rhizophorae]|uniref:Uncharacterized protein n=1 Tax=Lineolata rhizophorae TaxID=578093 RepID=A0A6A6NWW3_9PEZI|nr:hypothetical protein BDY21DRAFT_380496 [Lineolata rhizophorae]